MQTFIGISKSGSDYVTVAAKEYTWCTTDTSLVPYWACHIQWPVKPTAQSLLMLQVIWPAPSLNWTNFLSGMSTFPATIPFSRSLKKLWSKINAVTLLALTNHKRPLWCLRTWVKSHINQAALSIFQTEQSSWHCQFIRWKALKTQSCSSSSWSTQSRRAHKPEDFIIPWMSPHTSQIIKNLMFHINCPH